MIHEKVQLNTSLIGIIPLQGVLRVAAGDWLYFMLTVSVECKATASHWTIKIKLHALGLVIHCQLTTTVIGW